MACEESSNKVNTFSQSDLFSIFIPVCVDPDSDPYSD